MAFYLLSQITIQLFRSVLLCTFFCVQVASQSNDEKAITVQNRSEKTLGLLFWKIIFYKQTVQAYMITPSY